MAKRKHDELDKEHEGMKSEKEGFKQLMEGVIRDEDHVTDMSKYE